MEGIAILVVLTVLGGSVCGIIALIAASKLRRELQGARDEIQALRGEVLRTQSPQRQEQSSGSSESVREPEVREDRTVRDRSEAATDENVEREFGEAELLSDKATRLFSDLADNVKANWMIWLGGFCLALAGIFLVRYTVEQGLLGPAGRIIGGLSLGAAFHLSAEYLRRKTGDVHPAFAAMAGAGSITLYASLLAGLRLYELIDPGTAFLLLALVALATMSMAYVHGPVLAAFGILGAYLVPILVSTGGGQVVIALVYVLIVSASALLLLRYVYRDWLWWGFVAGAIGWWLLTLESGGADEFRPYYLTILAYLVVTIPSLDWLLQNTVRLDNETYDFRSILNLEPVSERYLVFTQLLIVLAFGISIMQSADVRSPWVWLLPGALFFFLARGRESLSWAPWLFLLALIGGWIAPQVVETQQGWTIELITNDAQPRFLWYLLATAITTAVLAIWNYRTLRFKAAWSSLATVGPVLLLATGYVLTSYAINSWYWGAATALLALAYVAAATQLQLKNLPSSHIAWLIVGGHFGLALAAAMMLNAATLTLALAAQTVSIAVIINKFELPDLDWLMKLVVAAVVARLTINPWLLQYADTVHWPLWTYGGSTLFAIAATRLLTKYQDIARWTEAAALHLFVLTVWAELRYVLYDGFVFEQEFTFTEALINIALFGFLSLVYYRRSLVSSNLRSLYVLFSYVLLGLSVGSYLYVAVMTATNDAWVVDSVGSTPIWNSLLGAFGVPVLLTYLFARFHDPEHRKLALGFTAISAFVFVSVQIRHLWEGTISYASPPTSPGELYTYSAVWMVVAVAAILGGAWRFGHGCYRAGMLLLAIVIAKLFLIDMSDLEGLLRVASFMGLGLSLLGVSYLYHRLQARTT
ncbi:MAG: DUF2339 domain-containing protein [Gammaproteobacteria bacterium]